jgi:hypothetical protein
VGAVFVAAIVVVVVVVIETSNPRSAKTASTTSVTNFVDSMKRANGARFVATYQVENFLYFQSGTIVVAQIPSPPGTKPTTNGDGYSGSGRYAYLYHGAKGRIAQWIKIGTNVSACMTRPSNGIYGALQCSRPSPYLPSNGFAMQDTGFVPTYVLQTLQELVGIKSSKPLSITTNVSQEFGTVRCLTQFSGPTTQTTCVNHDGFVVSWVLDNGSRYSSRATLTSLSRTPSAKDFTTLIKPTKALILPAV